MERKDELRFINLTNKVNELIVRVNKQTDVTRDIIKSINSKPQVPKKESDNRCFKKGSIK